MNKHISIIIATFNRKQYLKKILLQISNLDIPKNILIDIIVVNAGSSDNTSEMCLTEYKDINLIHGSEKWWWTKCMNEGFKKAIELGSDYVLILNDDNEIDPNYLEILWEDYKTLPLDSILGSASISIGQPGLITSAGTKKIIYWRLKFVNYITELKPLYLEFNGVHPTWSLSGRGTLIPINIFYRIGLYDEKLVQYGSDDEFILRAKKMGIQCFISWNARIYHHLMLTSEGTVYRKDAFYKFIRSFFNPFSINSIKKEIYLYNKYGYKVLLPFFIVYIILGTIKAYLFKY